MQENQTTPETTQVALYARHSGQDEGSIQTQLEAMRSHAEENGLEVVREYADQNGSRAQFDEMMAEAAGEAAGEDPPFRQILVYDLGQFTRSAGEFQRHRAKLEENGVTLTSIT